MYPIDFQTGVAQNWCMPGSPTFETVFIKEFFTYIQNLKRLSSKLIYNKKYDRYLVSKN